MHIIYPKKDILAILKEKSCNTSRVFHSITAESPSTNGRVILSGKNYDATAPSILNVYRFVV